MNNNNQKLQHILTNLIDNKQVFGATFAVSNKPDLWQGSAGNIALNQQFFIASTTKLFTTAIIMQLRSESKLNLSDKITKYLDQETMFGLHIFKNHDYSKDISIEQLLAHTSGLPDYFQGKNQQGQSLELQLTSGQDRAWSFEEAIAISKTLSPIFPPGTPRKAHYSDTNYQILGRIIEIVTGHSYEQNLRSRIIDPHKMINTYLYTDPSDQKPQIMYYKQEPLPIPLAMSSFGPDGGVVSTTSDLMTFIKAFFDGKIFPADYLPEMQVWNRIFFPLQSGIGLHLFQMPKILQVFTRIPPLIGHSGLSGALAYYCPQKEIYIVGTVNQIAHPDKSFRTMIKLLKTLV